MLNDVEYATLKMIVMQMSSYLFVISFLLMFYKTLHIVWPEPYAFLIAHLISAVQFSGTDKLSFLSMQNCFHVNTCCIISTNVSQLLPPALCCPFEKAKCSLSFTL